MIIPLTVQRDVKFLLGKLERLNHFSRLARRHETTLATAAKDRRTGSAVHPDEKLTEIVVVVVVEELLAVVVVVVVVVVEIDGTVTMTITVKVSTLPEVSITASVIL